MSDISESAAIFESQESCVLAALDPQKTYAIKEAAALAYEKHPYYSEADLHLAVFRLIAKESLIINGCGLLVKV